MAEHVFRVRKYQQPLHKAWVTGRHKRLLEIAHRRWGKDEVALNCTRDMALRRPATYWHCLPEYAQARKAIWDAVNPHTGKRRIDEAFPQEIREATNNQEMIIRLRNGATWQVIGSDRYNSLVGSSVAGVVFSEWALANPEAWAYIRPMVVENDGWAAFITTPRGDNHAKSMHDLAIGSPQWFVEVSSVYDTGALTQEQLSDALDEYKMLYGADLGLAIYEQEYLCSFSAAVIGAYWGGEMAAADREGRIGSVPVDYDYPVHTAWDLGKAANNPIWCFQVIGDQLRVVDFYKPEVDDIATWCKWLDDRGYDGFDYVPHDIMVTEWGSTRTRIEILRSHGRKPRRVQRVSVADGIQAGRVAINSAVFDKEACSLGIEGLRSYRREWDADRKVFKDTPYKDWAEHIGSSFRYLALAYREDKPEPVDDTDYFAPERFMPTIDEMIAERTRQRKRAEAR